MQAGDFRLYSRPEYLKALAADAVAARPGSSIRIASMSYDATDPLVGKLMAALTDAARRGVKVSLCLDAYSFIWDSDRNRPGPLWYGQKPSAKLRQPFGDSFAALARLAEAGGSYTIINRQRPFGLPQTGRSHIKAAVIGNKIYIGGCNLRVSEQIDLMVSRTDEHAASWLCGQLDKMVSRKSTQAAFGDKDLLFQINANTKLLIDSGKPKQSAIYESALDIIDQAKKSIFITCQYFPGGLTGQRLLAAQKRGVNVTIMFSPANIHGNEVLLHKFHIWRERQRLPIDFFDHELDEALPRLHAKLLASEKSVMIGSHNYIGQGVRLGTAEIALLSTNKKLRDKSLEVLRENIKSAAQSNDSSMSKLT